MVNEQVSKEIVAFAFKKGEKITSELLRNALSTFSAEKAAHVGKQTLEQLASKSGTLQNIEVTENNIKDFEKYARKYKLDFALKKDDGNPATYFVFFEGKSLEVMEKAFHEYEKEKIVDKPSVKKEISIKRIEQTKDKNREREKQKQKDRNAER